MPNVFGISTAAYPTRYLCPLYDPRLERENRRRFMREAIPELEFANSIYVPGGRWPARGWLLLRRADYDKLDLYWTDFRLQMDNFDPLFPPVTLRNLVIVQARCVSRGVATDPDAIYLVEVTDRRGMLWNQWFSFPTTSQYNMRSPAYPDQYYATSLNAGAAYTWTAMLRDLWQQMSTFLGSYPGLPITPIEDAENFSFPGTSAWLSLNDALKNIGCSVSVDLTNQPASYGIAADGATDAAFTALSARFQPRLEDDLEYIDTGNGRVPGSVTVLFHRRNEFYGTEETIRRDALQWSMTPSYSVTVPAPAVFAAATGRHYIWSEFSVRYDIDNNPLAADVATAALVAAQRAQEYYDHIYSSTVGFMRRTYTGALPFFTGSEVSGVAWKMNFPPIPPEVGPTLAGHRDTYKRAGWVTQVVRGPGPAFEECRFDARQH